MNERTEVIKRLEFCRIERYSGSGSGSETIPDIYWVFGVFPDEDLDQRFLTLEKAKDYARSRDSYHHIERNMRKNLLA